MLEPLVAKSTPSSSEKRGLAPSPPSNLFEGHDVLLQDVDNDVMKNPYNASLGADSPYEYFQSMLSSPSSLQSHVGDPDLRRYIELATSDAPICSSDTPPSSSHSSMPPAPRQRIEIFSMPPAAVGQTWDYQWKTYLDAETIATGKFFHMCEIIPGD